MNGRRASIAAFVLLCAAAGGSVHAQGTARSAGERVYVDQGCAVCHGLSGDGGVGPTLAGDPLLAPEEYVVDRILRGGTEMPSFEGKLSDDEIAAVASYIRDSWGNGFGQVSAGQIATDRKGLKRAEQKGVSIGRQSGSEKSGPPGGSGTSQPGSSGNSQPSTQGGSQAQPAGPGHDGAPGTPPAGNRTPGPTAGQPSGASEGPSGRSDAAAMRGEQVVMHGSAGGAPPCAACHGETGIGDGSGAFPRLTGQFAPYLLKELQGFADGTRANPVMSPVAKRLSKQEMADVAAYYASQQGPYFPRRFVEQPVLEQGGALVAIGRAADGVPACMTCHGRAGVGMGPNFPYLGGQYWSYLASQLRNFKNGSRRNDPGGVMRDVAGKLSDEDVQTVAAYLSSVRPSCNCELSEALARKRQ